MKINKIYCGDCLEILKQITSKSVYCCVTSPPYYGLRDYGVCGQIGNEDTLKQYIENLVNIFEEIKRILKDDGTLWLNLGDSWAGSNQDVRLKFNGYKPKDLLGIPWLVAFALRENGWYLRQDIIWAKGNPMTESVKDRCTKSHEYIFLLSKSQKYYFDYKSIKEHAITRPQRRDKNKEGYQANYPKGDRFSVGSRVYGADGMRNKRDVWNINTKPCKEVHFATFPDTLIEPCVLAGCPEGEIVLDPFIGSGTTAIVAKRNNRKYFGIEIKQEYVDIANERLRNCI